MLLLVAGMAKCLVAGSCLAAIPEHDPHTLIVKFAPSVDGKALAHELKNTKSAIPARLAPLTSVGVDSITPLFPIPPCGIRNQRAYDSLQMSQYYLLRLDDARNAADVLKDISHLSVMESVEVNSLHRGMESATTPNDPGYGWQWHYPRIRLPDAWSLTTGSAAVIVGVLDSGIDFFHPDFSGRLAVNVAEYNGLPGVDDDSNLLVDDISGFDFYNWDGVPQDDHSHGTHVSGTIGAASNNGGGVAGVDWNCLILPCKVLNASNEGTTAILTNGIYYATNMGCWILNVSIGGGGGSALETALNYAYANAVAVVAAMGNENTTTPSYPAAWPTTLAVGATDVADWRWYWGPTAGSNFGSHIDVCAPGDSIYSANPTWHSEGPYAFKTGTSMATPHVTGLAALILSVRPTLSVDSLYWYIEVGAQDLVGHPSEDTPGWDQYYGWGRINAYNSLRLALGQCVCECAYDPYCDGIRSDVLDVVQTVNVAFRGFSAVTDPGCRRQRSDVDASGATDVLDIVKVVNVAFRGFSVASQFVNPCQ
jgi:subtilisin family serine protease